jgi:PP-loop superfamily ATP-utilizing enzyme
MTPDIGETIAVWFSCGAASAVAAKLTVEKYGQLSNVVVVNNPVAEEHEDNRRFLYDVEKWIGVKIQFATNPKYPTNSCQEVWEKRAYMSGVAGAPCTLELKKKARQHWEATNHADYHVLGFTADEKHRHDRFILTERPNTLPILIEAGVTKRECYRILQKAGIELLAIYSLGYPNANCMGCVKATSPTYWNHVRKVHPEVFQRRADLSRKLGARLVQYKGKRLFLDELPLDAKGRAMKNMDFECGIFCEEKF